MAVRAREVCAGVSGGDLGGPLETGLKDNAFGLRKVGGAFRGAVGSRVFWSGVSLCVLVGWGGWLQRSGIRSAVRGWGGGFPGCERGPGAYNR